MSLIEEYFAKTNLPEAALKPIADRVTEFTTLVAQNNKRIAQVNAAKAVDPAKPGYADYLDDLWAAHTLDDEKIAAIEPKYQALVEEAEKLQRELRDLAKNHIPEVLSEDETQKVRKLVNESGPVIAESRKAVIAMLTVPTSLLSAMQVELPEGGLESLLPQADSLKNTRGRRAATESGEVRQNVTRVGEILLNNKTTNRDGKGKIAYAAADLSELWNAQNVPANKVTAEEIETEYFKSLPGNIAFRSLRSPELPPEHVFVFEKNIHVQNSNDDSFTEVPQKVTITLRNVNFGKVDNADTSTVTTVDSEVSKNKETVSKPEPTTPAAKKATPAQKK